jgi:type IV secretory pathway TraG/TraD family ATPase VirD4
MLVDHRYAASLIDRVTDPLVRSYWTDQIASTADFHKSEVLDWLVSKFSAFTHDPRIRRVIGQGRSAFTLADVMNNSQILICNLAQGQIGRSTSRFLGMTLVNQLLDAAVARSGMRETDRRDCYVFIDEFQELTTESFQPFLSGARKQHVALVLANQHAAQLPAELRAALYGNVGTLVSFRTGVQDAPHIAAAMQPSCVSLGRWITEGSAPAQSDLYEQRHE